LPEWKLDTPEKKALWAKFFAMGGWSQALQNGVAPEEIGREMLVFGFRSLFELDEERARAEVDKFLAAQTPPPIKLLPATIEHARLLFDWRNDPLTRAMSNNTAPVEWAGHELWLRRRLIRPDPTLWVAEMDGALVGTVRIDGDEISYTVAPEHRGRGVAKAMLTEAARRWGPKRAEIKAENTASIKAAEAAGHLVKLI
jgi:RimJ/RimL family protein N-acetyltransferase